MRCSRVIFAGLGALLLATIPRQSEAQTFEGEVGLKTPNGSIDAVVKGAKARFTTQTAMGPAAIIMDPASGEMYIVVDAQRMIMVMKLDDAIRTSTDTSTGTLTALNRTDMVAGHQCAVFRYLSATSAEDLCVASGLGQLGITTLFGGSMMGRGRPSSPHAPGWAGALAQQGGFPLRVADTTGVVKYEVTRIQSKSIPDSLLTPPADYQRMNMPSFGRPPGN